MASSSRTKSTFSPRSTLFSRASSPTRVTIPPVRFSTDHRSTSPSRSRSISMSQQSSSRRKKTCTCSPTNHPGSFRCALHRGNNGHNRRAVSYQSRSLNFRRSAMTNSVVRIGVVEGGLVRRALAALIRPSSHQQRRRMSFQTRPSRLSVMSKADDF